MEKDTVMSDTPANEALPFLDAFFLYCEQAGAPLNVALISAFEGRISLDECLEYVDSKISLIPRYLQRVVIPSFCIAPPTFEYDPHFDVRNHLHEITLKRGTDREWKAAVSQILSKHLDRRRPLWDITLLHGLKSDRTGVVIRMHHCMVDGIAGVGLLNLLLDPNPVVPPAHPRKRSVLPPPQHNPGSKLLDGLISSCFSTAQAFLTAHSQLLRMAENAATPKEKEPQPETVSQPSGPLASIAPLGDLTRLLSELAQPTERLPYNVLCHGPQLFEWTEFPMAEIIAVKKACEATVNEVVLTIVSAALRRYAELHDINIKGRTLRLVVPVNVRTNGEASTTGNQITFLPVDIPWSVCGPQEALSIVQERVKFARTAHGAELVALAAVLLSAMPSPLQSLTGTVLSQLPISVCNTICTNVPGPRTPLYLLGHRMISAYPYVPIGGEMGMNCAVMSYDGKLFVGFTGDAKAIPDLSSLPALIAESFAELRDAVGVHIPKVKRPRPKRKAASTRTRKASPAPHEAPLASSEAPPVAGDALQDAVGVSAPKVKRPRPKRKVAKIQEASAALQQAPPAPIEVPHAPGGEATPAAGSEAITSENPAILAEASA
jgi:diacylglycerol O-acyltransferase